MPRQVWPKQTKHDKIKVSEIQKIKPYDMMFAIYGYYMYTHKWLVKTLVKERVSLGVQQDHVAMCEKKNKQKKNLCEAQPGHVEPLMASKRQEWMLQLK